MHRLEEKEVRKRYHAYINRFPWQMGRGLGLAAFENRVLTGHRQPTPAEISRGYGVTHYKEFPLVVWINSKTGEVKRWIKCEYDGLRYYS